MGRSEGYCKTGGLVRPRGVRDTPPMRESLDNLAVELGRRLSAAGLALATAESCTGGWVAKVVTDIPGSSAWFDRGFVTYTDLAKREMLGVSAVTLSAQGAVSEATVRAMALGALAHSRAGVALAVSGIAGPGGGSAEKPVGSVWFAWALPSLANGDLPQVHTQLLQFDGDRDEVRHQAVHVALGRLLEWLPTAAGD